MVRLPYRLCGKFVCLFVYAASQKAHLDFLMIYPWHWVHEGGAWSPCGISICPPSTFIFHREHIYNEDHSWGLFSFSCFSLTFMCSSSVILIWDSFHQYHSIRFLGSLKVNIVASDGMLHQGAQCSSSGYPKSEIEMVCLPWGGYFLWIAICWLNTVNAPNMGQHQEKFQW